MQHEISLRLIDEIARAGSIRGAAEKMAITPSALNRRLLAIEEELDVPLFERTPGGVRLNAAGELFIAHARRQLADMARLRSQIEDLKGARRGHVQIAHDRSLIQDGAVAQALAAYQDAHPGVSFGVETAGTAEIARSLVSYRADLGFLLQPRSDAQLTSLASAPARLRAVTRAGHPLAGDTPLRLEALTDYPLVLPPEGALRSLIDLAARTMRLPLAPALEAPAGFAAPRLRDGDAVAIEVDAAPAPMPAPDGLARTPLSTRDIPPAFVHLLQLRDRPLSVAAGRFAERIKQDFADLSA